MVEEKDIFVLLMQHSYGTQQFSDEAKEHETYKQLLELGPSIVPFLQKVLQTQVDRKFPEEARYFEPNPMTMISLIYDLAPHLVSPPQEVCQDMVKLSNWVLNQLPKQAMTQAK